MNEATQLDTTRLPVVYLPSALPNKSQCQGQGRTEGQMINLENHLPTPALQFLRSEGMQKKSLLFLGTWALQPELQPWGKCTG